MTVFWNGSGIRHANNLQTDNHITQFLQAGCSSWCPTNSVKALKAYKTLNKAKEN